MQLEVGAIVEGKVSGITKFGVFVDLEGGKTGLVHISEVAQTYVNEIRDFVTDGQVVKVKVLSIGQDGKISLSIKRAADPAPRASGASRGVAAPRPAPRRRPPAVSPGRPDGYEWSARTFDNQTFEDKMSKFKQTSDDKFSDLKKKNPDARRSGYSRRGRA